MKQTLSIFFGIIIIFNFFLLGYMHEQVHVEIFKSYGIESHIEYFSHFPDFVTIADEWGSCTNECKLAHNINEAIMYPLQIFYIVISSGLFILITLKELNLELLIENNSE